jgi:peptide/nickel transport system substrate-binding protein
MELAQQLIAEYKAEHPEPITIALSTTPDQQNQTIAQAQAEWFKEAGIDDVQISTIQQGEYILFALRGDFNVFQWRNHGGIYLDQQYIWWHSSTAQPIDGQTLGLNFGRIKDPVIDEALDANRGETDPAKKKEYAETIARQFATECYDLWRWYTQWGLPHVPEVKGLDAFVLPSGTPGALGAGIAGTFNVGGVWRDQ